MSKDVAGSRRWASRCFGRLACSYRSEHEASCSCRIGLHSRGCLVGRLAATFSHHTECGNSSGPLLSIRPRLTGTSPNTRTRSAVFRAFVRPARRLSSTSDLIKAPSRRRCIRCRLAARRSVSISSCHQPQQRAMGARNPPWRCLLLDRTHPNNFSRRLTSVRVVLEISRLHPNRAREHRDKRHQPGGIDENQDVTDSGNHPCGGRHTARASCNRRTDQ